MKLKLVLASLILAPFIASAQQNNVFTPGTTVTLSASGTSSQSAISSAAPNVLISNSGTVTVFVKFGADSTVTATSSDMPVLAGTVQVFNKGTASNVAVITGGTAATVYVTSGYGQ